MAVILASSVDYWIDAGQGYVATYDGIWTVQWVFLPIYWQKIDQLSGQDNGKQIILKAFFVGLDGICGCDVCCRLLAM